MGMNRIAATAGLAALTLSGCDRAPAPTDTKPFDHRADMSDRSATLTGAHQIRYRELTECRSRLWHLRKGTTPFTRGAGDARIEATKADGREVVRCQEELARATR